MSDRTTAHRTGADAPPTTTTGPALTYMQWRAGDSRRGAVETVADGPPVGHKCPLCPDPIGAGEPFQVVAIGPDNPRTVHQHEDRKTYRAAATVAHLLCVQEVSDDALDRIADALLAGGAVRHD